MNNNYLEKLNLVDFGIRELCFQSQYNYLHRVFNRNSFDYGGRFYGGFHLQLPRELRKYILINGEPTVELDYSAQHIRMLYHMEEIDYVEDPYLSLCENEDERKMYKLVLLVAINAPDERTAVNGIRNVLRKASIDCSLTNKSILGYLEKFKSGHPLIAKYLTTGIGLTLQNLDSKITEIILMTMTEHEIPCLPVHDSFIVPERHEDLLMTVMKNAYEEVMGFTPIVSVKEKGGIMLYEYYN